MVRRTLCRHVCELHEQREKRAGRVLDPVAIEAVNSCRRRNRCPVLPKGALEAVAVRNAVPVVRAIGSYRGHEFASEWLADRARELRPTTLATYEWELTHHLLPHFARVRVDAIGVEEVDRYRRRKVAEGKLGATSINETIGRLGQILDVAQERGLIVQNPVRVNPRNRKVRQSRPSRPWLEPEQVLQLLDAAADLDRGDGRGLAIRRPLLATLAWAGLRVGEATALRWRDVSLADGAIRVDQSKTAAGVRTVDVQPELHDERIAWRAVTPFPGPDEIVFPTRSGSAQNRHNVRQRVVLKSAAAGERSARGDRASAAAEGLSPHTLRRSFASWLIA